MLGLVMQIEAVHRVMSLQFARTPDALVRQVRVPRGLLVAFLFGDDDQTDSPLRQAAQLLLFPQLLMSRRFLLLSQLSPWVSLQLL